MSRTTIDYTDRGRAALEQAKQITGETQNAIVNRALVWFSDSLAQQEAGGCPAMVGPDGTVTRWKIV